jgi:glycosyltransferase involved in cell wall biosynthesis
MKATGRARLVVMMPALNEEKTVGDVISGIPRDIEGVAEVRVVVVDDGSTDATGEIAREHGALVVRHRARLGLGRSYADGVEAALAEGADVIVSIDADGQFDPADIPTLAAPVLKGEADFVTCTRFARTEWVPDMPPVKKWGNRRMCNIVNWATGQTSLTDVSCGFRAFSREAALRMNLFGRFTYTHESIIGLARGGMRIAEVPLRVRGEREHGSSRVAHNVLKYGARAMSVIVRAMCYTRPLLLFGCIALALVLMGLALGGYVVWDLVFSGVKVTAHRALLLGCSLLLILGFLVGLLALVADMLGKQIRVSEQLLYHARRRYYGEAARRDDEAHTPADR